MLNPIKAMTFSPGQIIYSTVEWSEPGGYSVLVENDNELPGFLPTQKKLRSGQRVVTQFVCIHSGRIVLGDRNDASYNIDSSNDDSAPVKPPKKSDGAPISAGITLQALTASGEVVFNEQISALKDRIEKEWLAQEVRWDEGEESFESPATVIASFFITPSRELVDLCLDQSSGKAILNMAALQSITRTFPHIGSDWHSTSRLRIGVVFFLGLSRAATVMSTSQQDVSVLKEIENWIDEVSPDSGDAANPAIKATINLQAVTSGENVEDKNLTAAFQKQLESSWKSFGLRRAKPIVDSEKVTIAFKLTNGLEPALELITVNSTTSQTLAKSVMFAIKKARLNTDLSSVSDIAYIAIFSFET